MNPLFFPISLYWAGFIRVPRLDAAALARGLRDDGVVRRNVRRRRGRRHLDGEALSDRGVEPSDESGQGASLGAVQRRGHTTNSSIVNHRPPWSQLSVLFLIAHHQQ